MDVVVGDAGALVVGQVGGGVVEEQVEDAVTFARAHDGAEDADLGGSAGHLGEHPQGDGRLARLAFRGRDVHAGDHTGSVSVEQPTSPLYWTIVLVVLSSKCLDGGGIRSCQR